MIKPANLFPKTIPLLLAIVIFSNCAFSQTTVHLQWSPATGTDADYFIIERGLDSTALNYHDLVKVKAGANPMATYQTKDDISHIKAAVVYYRLKTITKQVKVSYSSIVAITPDDSDNKVAEIISADNTDQLKATVTMGKSKSNHKTVARVGK